MKKVLAILFLTGTISLGAMEEGSENIILEVFLQNRVSVYASDPLYNKEKQQLEAALNQTFNNNTLLQNVCILNPNASNKNLLSCIPNTNIKIPEYLPLELLPSKDGETKKLTLYFTQNYVQKSITIKLKANQKGLERYSYNERSFADQRKSLLQLAIEHPPTKQVDNLIKDGFIKKRWRLFGNYVPGSNNQYLPADKTDIYALFGASSIAALGLFAWWKKWW